MGHINVSCKLTAAAVEGGAHGGGRDPEPDAGGVPRQVQGPLRRRRIGGIVTQDFDPPSLHSGFLVHSPHKAAFVSYMNATMDPERD